MSRARKTKVDTQDTNALSRQEQALYYRELGYDYAKIAETCGYPHKMAAYRAVQKARSRNAEIQEDKPFIRSVQNDQLNKAIAICMEKINNKGQDALWAIDRLVALHKRQAELLGLDEKAEISSAQVIYREIRGNIGDI